MPQSENYIKVKSRRQLRIQIKDSKQIIYKAGSIDEDNQPGSTTAGSPIRNSTGVSAPGEHEPYFPTNQVGYESSSQSPISGGSGNGSVEGPPEKPKEPPYTGNYLFPFSEGQRTRNRYLLNDPPLTDINKRTFEPGSVEESPSSTDNAGTLYKETERTVGLDGERVVRDRARRRKIIIKNY